MRNKVFVDTNVIIDLLNNQNNKYVQKLNEILQDKTVEIFINNLIVSEVLQGVKVKETKKYTKYKDVLLNLFNEIIEVDNQIIENSIDIYRQCKANGVNFNNENICQIPNCGRILYNSIDCIHYATCIIRGLHVLTNDKVFLKFDEFTNNQLVISV